MHLIEVLIIMTKLNYNFTHFQTVEQSTSNPKGHGKWTAQQKGDCGVV